MRDNIFKLCSDKTCRWCGVPIDITLYGTDASYDLVKYFIGDTLDNNMECFYVNTNYKYDKICKACLKNNKNYKHKYIDTLKYTGKPRYPLEYALTHTQVDKLWLDFINNVKDYDWLMNAYSNIEENADSMKWFMEFDDIEHHYHGDDESYDVYDLEEYSMYLI